MDDVVGDVVGLLWGCCGSTVRSMRSTVVGLLWVLWGLRERDMMYSRSRQGYQGHSLWLEGGVVGIRESRWMGGGVLEGRCCGLGCGGTPVGRLGGPSP